MADPTLNYNWDIPDENTDPWWDPFDTLISAIDTTQRSVENLTRCRHVTVFSAFPSAGLTLIGTTTITDSTWTVMSVAPFGRTVGSFSIVASGGRARFGLTLTSAVGTTGNTAAVIASPPTIFHRLIVNPGSILIPSNSAWKFMHHFRSIDTQNNFSAVASLGIGAYSVEWQTRALVTAGQELYWTVSSDSFALLEMTEVVRGT